MAQYYCLLSRRGNRRITGYETVATTKKASKKASQNVKVIKFPFLINLESRKGVKSDNLNS